jgi:hypothetical protein
MSGLTCEDARNLFDAHLDGELPLTLATELNAHRLRCPRCRHELAVLEVAGEVIAADDTTPALDDEFTSRLLSCVSSRQTPRQLRQRRLLRIGTRALAAAACVAIVVGYLNRPRPRVAGFRYTDPKVVAHEREPQAMPRDMVEGAVQERTPLQEQLERALTEWRKDASSLSLEKIYHFITPQIHEQMERDRPEDVHDQSDPFEPGPLQVPPEGVPPSPEIIEDV